MNINCFIVKVTKDRFETGYHTRQVGPIAGEDIRVILPPFLKLFEVNGLDALLHVDERSSKYHFRVSRLTQIAVPTTIC